MNMNYSQIVDTYQTLMEISDTPMKYSSALKVSRNLSEFEKHAMDFETERKKLVEKYVKRDSSGDPIPLLDENGEMTGMYEIGKEERDKFNEDLKVLFDFEVNVITYPLSPEDFDEVKLSPKQIRVLGEIIED